MLLQHATESCENFLLQDSFNAASSCCNIICCICCELVETVLSICYFSFVHSVIFFSQGWRGTDGRGSSYVKKHPRPFWSLTLVCGILSWQKWTTEDERPFCWSAVHWAISINALRCIALKDFWIYDCFSYPVMTTSSASAFKTLDRHTFDCQWEPCRGPTVIYSSCNSALSLLYLRLFAFVKTTIAIVIVTLD